MSVEAEVLRRVFLRRGWWQTRHWPTSHPERHDPTGAPATRQDASRNIAARPETRLRFSYPTEPRTENRRAHTLPRKTIEGKEGCSSHQRVVQTARRKLDTARAMKPEDTL